MPQPRLRNNQFAPYSRRELKTLRGEWSRRNRGLVALVCGITVALIVGVTWAISSSLTGPARWYLTGAVQIGLAAAVLNLLHTTFLANDPHAIRHVRGAWGEENTRDELRRARRRRVVWDWVDSITLAIGDLDHLVIARSGGVIAIDSKWCNHIAPGDPQTMARSARIAQRRAEGVVATLLTSEYGVRRARAMSISVTPVVVIWGAAQHTLPADATSDGVRFIAGRQLLSWLRTLDGDEISRPTARLVARKLRQFRATSGQTDTVRRAPRQSAAP